MIHSEPKREAPTPLTSVAGPVVTTPLLPLDLERKRFWEVRREIRERRHMSLEDTRSKKTSEDQSHGKRELEADPHEDAKKQRRS